MAAFSPMLVYPKKITTFSVFHIVNCTFIAAVLVVRGAVLTAHGQRIERSPPVYAVGNNSHGVFPYQEYPDYPILAKNVKKPRFWGFWGGVEKGSKMALLDPLFVTPFLDIFRTERISHGTLQRTCQKNVIMCVAQ